MPEPDWGLMHRAHRPRGLRLGRRLGPEGRDRRRGFSFQGANLKAINPERYGSLVHPGDGYSFDIFSQVGRLLRDSEAGGRLDRSTPIGSSPRATHSPLLS